MNDVEDEKQSSRSSFNLNARLISTVSGITGGMMMCIFSLAMYSNSDSKWWLAGAAAGVLGTIGSFVQGYRLSTQAEAEQGKSEEQRAGDKAPDLKP